MPQPDDHPVAEIDRVTFSYEPAAGRTSDRGCAFHEEGCCQDAGLSWTCT